MRHKRSSLRQCGLSLVELMIAITIGVALLTGVVQIFANSKSTYRTQEALSRVSENVRFALEVLTQDISVSNFWGCNTDPATVFNQLDPAAGASFIDFVQGGPTGTGGGLFGTDGGIGGTDTIMVRGLVGFPITVQPVNVANSPVVLSAVNSTLAADTIIALADCQSTDIFQITSIDGDNVTLRHAAAAGQPPQNVSARLSKDTYGQNSVLYRADQITYNLQIDTIANGGNGRPALFRNRNNNSLPLITDVDDFQVDYGLDTDADLDADSWVIASAGLNFNSVVAVRVTLTLSSPTDNVSPVQRNLPLGGTDNRLGKTVTTTIALRNQLP